MEHVDNDMDDLFRKAGNLYPLKTSESDWDGVLGKLNSETARDADAVQGLTGKSGRRNKRRWLLLLLLIPVGVGSFYFSRSKSAVSASAPMKSDGKNNAPVSATAPLNAVPPGKSHEVSRLETGSGTPQPTETASGITKSDSRAIHAGSRLVLHAGKNVPLLARSGPAQKNNRMRRNGTVASGFTATQAAEPVGIFSGGEVSERQSASSQSLYTGGLKTSLPALVQPDNAITVSVSSLKTTAVQQTTDGGSAITKPKQAVKKTKGIYLGLIGGPDLSTVKFQSVKQTGFGIGLQIGYRFSQHISVETGLLWNKKYYYSSGEYFNKKNVTIPWDIVDLNGDCNMFEIPLLVRYDFPSSGNRGFFAKTGLSSYLMKKESYDYEATSGGAPWPESISYKNQTNNLFSVLQISGGYAYPIGRNTRISVEPYVKIPLRGIGIGSMPISSYGLYFGISYSFP